MILVGYTTRVYGLIAEIRNIEIISKEGNYYSYVIHSRTQLLG